MSGPLINPPQEVTVREMDSARQFDESLRILSKIRGQEPRVRVIIQVRGKVRPVRELQVGLMKLARELDRRGVPEDEKLPIVARKLSQGDSREWKDAVVVWEGVYDPHQTKMPGYGDLDRVKRQTGAAEVRAVVREVT